jgi:hypothetical protein
MAQVREREQERDGRDGDRDLNHVARRHEPDDERDPERPDDQAQRDRQQPAASAGLLNRREAK